MPGDVLVPNARYVTTHAVTIEAPAEPVWPWLVQYLLLEPAHFVMECDMMLGIKKRTERTRMS